MFELVFVPVTNLGAPEPSIGVEYDPDLDPDQMCT